MKIKATPPTAKEISPTSGLDLDEQCALEHFSGLCESEALQMFRDDADHLHVYLADFVHMGDIAFSYYLPALVQHLDALPDDQFVEEAPDAADYVLIRFSDSERPLAAMEELIALIHNRLQTLPPEVGPSLPSRVAKFLAKYRQAEQGVAPNP